MEDSDVESATAKVSDWRALLFGFLHSFRLHYWGFRHGSHNKRCWIVAEGGAIVFALVLVFFVLDIRSLRYFAIAMAIGECLTSFFAVWTVHHDCNQSHIARTQRGWLKNLVSYNMFYHLEHHLFPNVPTCHLPELAQRLDRVAPDLRSKTVV